MTLISLSITAVRSRRLPRWSEVKALIIEWRQRVRSRYELTTLNDRELSDICVTRMEVRAEFEKPFWRR
jgi:uncharacterized protein YjiS (DUF1127 family)